MKQKYLKYYERYSSLAHFVFLFDALRARSRVEKLSLIARQRDYLGLGGRPGLLALHRDLNRYLLEAAKAWDAYDYGAGYFYQSLDLIGASGLRSTRGRVEAMGLAKRLEGRTVVEIGCNTGFLALTVAQAAQHIVGFDINPYLVAVARRAADYLGITNVDFRVCAFEDFAWPEPFDVVLSLANHSTYDGNTRQGPDDYFRRCRRLVKPGGLLIFESHPPEHEGGGLERVCSMIDELFQVEDRRVLDYGTFLDRGRTFIVARRSPVTVAARSGSRRDADIAAASPRL